MIKIANTSHFISNPPKTEELMRMSIKELIAIATWKRRISCSFKKYLIVYILNTWRKEE